MEEEKDKQEEQDGKEKSVAEIMAELKADFEKKISEKDNEIERMKAEHAKEVANILRGADPRKKQVETFDEIVDRSAENVARLLGAKIMED